MMDIIELRDKYIKYRKNMTILTSFERDGRKYAYYKFTVPKEFGKKYFGKKVFVEVYNPEKGMLLCKWATKIATLKDMTYYVPIPSVLAQMLNKEKEYIIEIKVEEDE